MEEEDYVQFSDTEFFFFFSIFGQIYNRKRLIASGDFKIRREY